MVKVEIDRNQEGRTVGSCQLFGSERQVIQETVDALGTIYAAIKGEFSPDYIAAFRQYLTLAVLDPSSPVWNTKPTNGEKVVFRKPEGRGRKG